MNGEYMKAMDFDKFYEMALPYMKEVITRDVDFKKIAAMVKKRIEVFTDIKEHIDFFQEVPEYSVDMYTHKKMKTNAETSLNVLKENGKVIGEIEAHPESSQPDKAENFTLDTFSPCWMLNKNYHGKGYAYEASREFFNYLFNEKGARRIYAYTEDYNIPSQKLCEKLGMRREGV